MWIERQGVFVYSAYVCVFRDFELLRYAQFSFSLCVNVKDRTTALISRWDEKKYTVIVVSVTVDT